jgi:cytochrome c oxidase subunit II
MRRFVAVSCLVAIALLVIGCGTHQQSVTNPVGRQAEMIEKLWWLTFWILSAIFVAVVAFLGSAVYRNRTGSQAIPEPEVRSEAQDRRASRVTLVLVLVVVLFEFGFLVASAMSTKHMRGYQSKNPIEIEVIGHRWWWEFRYNDPVPSQIVTTANELHVPVGMPILIKTSSQDVIHSFWAPNIAGKRDLIPGYQQSYWIQVDKEGIYRGQCAEFCGLQHAHMSFYVVAEPHDKYQQWLEWQRKPALDPGTQQVKGRDVFMSSPCVTCHTIRGTDAGSRVGPDLTHVASRSFIAAGTLPNTRENLRNWVRNAQTVKPGNQMPSIALSDEELDAVVAYLQSLK